MDHRESAENLARLLQRVASGHWMLFEEVALESVENAPQQQPEGNLIAPLVESVLSVPEQFKYTPPTEAIQAAPMVAVQPQVEARKQEKEAKSSKKYDERREHQRHKAEFRVILVTGGKAFRTFSDNVSFGGMHLKQQVPNYMVDQVCCVFIGRSSNPENIELKCRVVGDPSNPRSIAFKDVDSGNLKRLEDWLQNNAGRGFAHTA